MKFRKQQKRAPLIKKALLSVGFLIVTIGIAFLFLRFTNDNSSNEQGQQASENGENIDNTDESDSTEQNKENDATAFKNTIRISAAGDVMVHDTQLENAYNDETDSYEFKSSFENIKDIVQESDLAIVNLETTLSGNPPYMGYPVFNSPDSIVDAVSFAGFDTVITANNHSLDTQAEGLKRTIKVVKYKGLEPVGTYQDSNDSRILIKEINNIKVAVLAYTEQLNHLEQSYSTAEIDSMINTADEEQIVSDIQKAKEQKPDIILTYMHWGKEYAAKSNDVQKAYAELLAKEGVDIILGSHPHVVQNAEYIKVDGNEAFVAYSLGNFLSNQRTETLGNEFEATEDGVILNIDVQKNNETGETTIENIEPVPTWVYRNEYEAEKFEYRILPAESYMNDESLPNKVREQLSNSYKRTIDRLKLDQ